MMCWPTHNDSMTPGRFNSLHLESVFYNLITGDISASMKIPLPDERDTLSYRPNGFLS